MRKINQRPEAWLRMVPCPTSVPTSEAAGWPSGVSRSGESGRPEQVGPFLVQPPGKGWTLGYRNGALNVSSCRSTSTGHPPVHTPTGSLCVRLSSVASKPRAVPWVTGGQLTPLLSQVVLSERGRQTLQKLKNKERTILFYF